MNNYPGFVFWGLFAVFGVITVLYYVWMKAEERKEKQTKN